MDADKFAKLKKEGIKNPEAHEAEVKDSIDIVAKNILPLADPMQKLDIQKLEAFCVRAQKRIIEKVLPDYAKGGAIQDPRRFLQSLTLLYLEEYNSLPKDELLFIACRLSAQIAVEKLPRIFLNQ